ncbi:EB domain and Cysteine-rich repeat-containing protein [Aphelenchoides fujianensis]|nr:EB domain and Cysteine-rich repeat-containing protein [Aphelenchoides fujianensis]
MLTHTLLSVVFFLLLSVHRLEAQQQNVCPSNFIQLYNGVSCQTDQACQRLSPGFFCYNGYCCSNSVSFPSGYGSSCTYDNQCAFANSQCQGNICYCRTGFSFDGQNCQPQQGQYNVNALPTAPCSPNEISIGNQCWRLQEYFGECDFNQQCNFVGGVCATRKCTCSLSDIFDGRQCCYLIASLGQPCVFDQQCRTDRLGGGAACVGGFCQPNGGGGWNPRPPTCRNPSANVEIFGGAPKNCISQSCSPGYHCEYNAAIYQYICCGGSSGQYGEIKQYPGYTNLPLQCSGINSCTFVDFPYCVFSRSYNHNVCCSKQECL